ncbi:Ger(x)C family spore germination protein [Paenibacillus sp. ACRSA]|uniref:Ger(x)C family spore germination protein n=1 Tax=Paenibacillus sp. ACRSA TaxID=2918211 RepID=UPI001EF66168|nr:Ger(x)C family spore germination protein [Paenibacillus sp. ACRSA]MCG7380354.1 Ger(x)C family spore germination protein [Paenibacillus sp. ACRSA]
MMCSVQCMTCLTRKIWLWLIAIIMAIPLSGCWDSKEVQSINFITALGIDYVKDHYVAYAQLIDFSSIAKQDGPTSREGSQIWIGQGEGATLNMAVNDLYRSSQQQTLWTHVKAIVLTQNALNGHLEDIFDTLMHSGQLRYTPWIYATTDDMKDLLSSSALLNQSEQTIELFEPVKLYKQYSAFEPIRMHQLLDGFREPASTVLVPSVTNTNHTWTNQDRKPPLVQMNGFYVITGGQNQGKVDADHAAGARYVNYNKVYQYPLYVYSDKQKTPSLSLMLRDPRTVIRAKKSGTGVQFDLKTMVKAYITEDHSTHQSKRMLEQEAAQQIQNEIRHTFQHTQARKIDAYGLTEYLYRHDHPLWATHANKRADPLAHFKLGQVDVRVDIMNANTYKYNASK